MDKIQSKNKKKKQTQIINTNWSGNITNNVDAITWFENSDIRKSGLIVKSESRASAQQHNKAYYRQPPTQYLRHD